MLYVIVKELNKNQRKNKDTKDYVSLSDVESDFLAEKNILNNDDKVTETNYDLGHIYGSW